MVGRIARERDSPWIIMFYSSGFEKTMRGRSSYTDNFVIHFFKETRLKQR